MTRPKWQDLNAYVDGELPPDAAARVAQAVAADRELAGRVAALTQLKAAAGEALTVDPADVPALHLPGPAIHRPTSIRRRQLAYAAVALLLVLVGVAGLWSMSRPDAAQAWLAAAEAHHLEWLASQAAPAPIDERSVALTASRGAPQRVPDLGFARLRLAHVAIDASGEQPGLFVGYVGFNGCRLGLWIGPAAGGLATALVEHRNQNLTSFTWKVGSTGYAVIARNMDEQRLEAIAGRLEQATRLAAETRIAGLSHPAMDAPCTA
jgi:anti-sigma factor RsiW